MPNYTPLIYMILDITFAKNSKRILSLSLFWNAAYFYEGYIDDINDYM